MRLPGHAVRVAQARGKDPVRSALEIEFPNGGAPGFHGHAAFGDIAVGANGHKQFFSVGTDDDVFGPVVVDRAGRQGDHLGARGCDAGVASGVGKPQHRVGVGNEKIMADQGHAKRRIQPLKQHRPLVCDAITIGIPQQRDAVGAGRAGPGPLHHQAGQPALDAAGTIGLGRRVGLGHQDIAVGQDMKPARVVQVARERGHGHAGRRLRHDAAGPALGRSNVNGWNQRLPGRWQGGRGPGAGSQRQCGDVTTCRRQYDHAH